MGGAGAPIFRRPSDLGALGVRMNNSFSRITMRKTRIVVVLAAILAASPASAADTSLQEDPAKIEALIAEAMEHGPAVLAARAHYEATLKMPQQEATLPDPELSLQQLTVGGPRPFEGYETSDFYYTGFGVMQEIPWPEKLRLRARAASHEAEAAKQEYEAARREAA